MTMFVVCDMSRGMKRICRSLDSRVPFSALREAHDNTKDEAIRQTLKRAIEASSPDSYMDDPNAVRDLSMGFQLVKAMRNE